MNEFIRAGKQFCQVVFHMAPQSRAATVTGRRGPTPTISTLEKWLRQANCILHERDCDAGGQAVRAMHLDAPGELHETVKLTEHKTAAEDFEQSCYFKMDVVPDAGLCGEYSIAKALILRDHQREGATLAGAQPQADSAADWMARALLQGGVVTVKNTMALALALRGAALRFIEE